MLSIVKALTQTQKRLILLTIDVLIVPVAVLLTLAIQENSLSLSGPLGAILPILPLLVIAAGAISWSLGIPHIRLIAYQMSSLGKTGICAAYLAALGLALSQLTGAGIPLGFFVLFGLLFFLFSALMRLAMLRVLTRLYQRDQARCRVLIYGAGNTGRQLALALNSHETILPLAFVDDNRVLQGLTVAGLPVHAPQRMAELVRDKEIRRVLLAIPSLSRPKQARISRDLARLGVEVQVLPSFAQLIGEDTLVDKLAPPAPAQFLGRSRLDGEVTGGSDHYAGRSVLISGAGGSIGSELCRQILACRPRRLVLFEQSELALYTIDMELRQLLDQQEVEIVPVLGSVQDGAKVARVLRRHAVQVVFHAAAYKHVPLVEDNPLAGLSNNVLGTHVLARESGEAGVERFILVSSDKAVRPTNVMGASKRLAEQVVQDLASRSQTTVFTMVRFGNVLGSSGSVLPLFLEQISRGGPVTLTHAEATRYFMTTEEAVRLVLYAGSFAAGGEVFVLDMGQPVAIHTLVRQVIEGSGYSVRDAAHPEGDIEIVVTGLRPGEKLHEELLISGAHQATRHPKILSAREGCISEIEVAASLRALRQAIEAGDADAARAVAARVVEGYGPPPPLGAPAPLPPGWVG
ncbi:polysaccharide biosynthesis protein [Shimia sp.]|uniref:polysaccharide biosynthesis protein n=1 Tax=Shimia sp. TaxID=1954381 RepID=UPI0035623C04